MVCLKCNIYIDFEMEFNWKAEIDKIKQDINVVDGKRWMQVIVRLMDF